jgi:hypothetical protein
MFTSSSLRSIISFSILLSVVSIAHADEPVVDIESIVGSVKLGTDGIQIKTDGVGSVSINTKGSDPAKVCGETKMPRLVIQAKMAPLSVDNASVQAQAEQAIAAAGLKTALADTAVAVCLISDAGELNVDLSDITIGRLDVHAAAGAVNAKMPSKGTPNGRLFTDTGSITLTVPRGMGVVLSGSKAGLGAITLDKSVARQGDKTHRANFNAVTSAGIIEIVPEGANTSDVEEEEESEEQ